MNANEMGRRLVAQDRIINKLEAMRYITRKEMQEITPRELDEILKGIERLVKKELSVSAKTSTQEIACVKTI